LLAIPRASLRTAQTAHDLEEPFEENTGRLGHDRFLRLNGLYITGLRVC
jgi:hypothetical protein